MLVCEGLETYYGAAHVLFDVSLRVETGQVACLLGRNGVGKTTCLRSIMGLTPARSGSIRFKEMEIRGLPAYEVARRGVGYVPEDRRVFSELTVKDNLIVAERRRRDRTGWTLDHAYRMFPALLEFRDRLGGRLSGGQQQMLTIARTLMGNPELVLIDEPTEGLSPVVVQGLEASIVDLKRNGLTMLLAAQDIRFALSLADHVYIMDRGRIVYSKPIAEARGDEATMRARLAV